MGADKDGLVREFNDVVHVFVPVERREGNKDGAVHRGEAHGEDQEREDDPE